MIRWSGHAARMGESIGACWGKPEGKSPLGRPRRRWEDNVKTFLKEVGWKVADLVDLAQDRHK